MNYLTGCAIGGCDSDNTGLIVLIVIGVIVLLVIAYLVYSFIKKRKSK